MESHCDETITHSTATIQDTASSLQPRQPLGQLSPNVGRNDFSRSVKRLETSPLKRSCLAALDAENGFTYLKRRKLSTDVVPYLTSEHGGARTMSEHANAAKFRPFTAEVDIWCYNNDLKKLLIVFQSTEDLPFVATPDENEQHASREQCWDRSSSTERQSFSSLINYDPSSQPGNPSRQNSKMIVSEPPKLSTATPLVLSTATHAEALRLRLRIAMYKVQTDQIHTPFDYLQEQTAEGIKESSRAVQEAVDQLRHEAREILSTRRRPRQSGAVVDAIQNGAKPSVSGPIRAGPDCDVTGGVLYVHTPRSRPNRLVAAELTSSAVKSTVAEGLLGLKHAI